MRNITGSHFDGNAARKIEYDVYSENRVLKEKKITRARGKVTSRVVFVVFLVFLMGITVMYRYALLTEINYDIDRLNQQYMDLKNDNSMLRVEIGAKTVLEEIADTAKTRLGMALPVSSQIIHLRVPGEDYTVVSEEYRKEGPSTVEEPFTVLVDKISRLSKLLY
jgi:cell division protein FtsL